MDIIHTIVLEKVVKAVNNVWYGDIRNDLNSSSP